MEMWSCKWITDHWPNHWIFSRFIGNGIIWVSLSAAVLSDIFIISRCIRSPLLRQCLEMTCPSTMHQSQRKTALHSFRHRLVIAISALKVTLMNYDWRYLTISSCIWWKERKKTLLQSTCSAYRRALDTFWWMNYVANGDNDTFNANAFQWARTAHS